eukprot:534870-Rhodomonas_salina.1
MHQVDSIALSFPCPQALSRPLPLVPRSLSAISSHDTPPPADGWLFNDFFGSSVTASSDGQDQDLL